MAAATPTSTQFIATVAGTGAYGYNGDNQPATTAQLWDPTGVALNSAGDLYISDWANGRVRRVDHASSQITTVAGTGVAGYNGDNQPATSAQLNYPNGVALNSAGDLYISDGFNERVRRVDHASGQITTVAGTGAHGYNGDNQLATSAQLSSPNRVALNSVGDLYIADSSNGRVRRVDHATGQITTVAGTGVAGYNGDNQPATSAQLNSPASVALNTAGDVYISDFYNHRVRRVDHATGQITTMAGTGVAGYNGDNQPATSAQLNSPASVALNTAGDLYMGDEGNHRVRRVDHATGQITTVAGTGVAGYNGDNQPATSAQLNYPVGVALNSAGDLYIADWFNSRVRMLTLGAPPPPPTCTPNWVKTSFPANVTFGSSFTSPTQVAEIDDPCVLALAGQNYTATLDWGDGTVEPAEVGRIIPGKPIDFFSVRPPFWTAGQLSPKITVTRPDGVQGSGSGITFVQSRYVALGDSYSSGEGSNFPAPGGCSWKGYQDPAGAGVLIDNGITYNSPANTDDDLTRCLGPGDRNPEKGNMCHRSLSAYPHGLGQLTDIHGATLDFHACSGATIQDYWQDAGTRSGDQIHQGEPAQRAWLQSDVSLVTLSLGGNNMHFADVAKKCVSTDLLSHDVVPCMGQDSAEVDLLAGLRSKLIATYQDIHMRAPGARLLVVGYPRWFPDGGTGTDCEHFRAPAQPWLNDRIALVNKYIQDAVSQSGYAEYVDVYHSLDGHNLGDTPGHCFDAFGDSNQWLNGVNVVNGALGSTEVLHPTPAGHNAFANLVARRYSVAPTTTPVPPGIVTYAPTTPAAQNPLVLTATWRTGSPVLTVTGPNGATLSPVQLGPTSEQWSTRSGGGPYTLKIDNTGGTMPTSVGFSGSQIYLPPPIVQTPNVLVITRCIAIMNTLTAFGGFFVIPPIPGLGHPADAAGYEWYVDGGNTLRKVGSGSYLGATSSGIHQVLLKTIGKNGSYRYTDYPTCG